MDDKNQYKPEIWEPFSLEEVEFSIFDDPPAEQTPKKKAAKRNYKEAYFCLSHAVRKTICRLETCLIESSDGEALAAMMADLDDALEEAERELLARD